MKIEEVLKKNKVDYTLLKSPFRDKSIKIYCLHDDLVLSVMEQFSHCEDFVRFCFYSIEQDCFGKKFKYMVVVD